jgi:phosphopantothenoylcysteine decarboxylase/phosphopantothenate--cysteine ligase
MRLQGKKIILGVSGSIAAYKAVFLLRLLQQEGAEVRVVLTAGAQKFVTPLTFSTLAHHPVFTDLWNEAGNWSEHVQWGLWADLMIVAPATANTLAKLAHGICDDALCAVALSLRCPLLVSPAMDLEMYKHAATQANLHALQARGVQLVEAEYGYLASGLEGQGRMAEPEHIVAAVVKHFSPGPLQGKRLLISAGPTQEALDPVRYISNHSTGKMGIALAAEAARLGATVTLVLGPTTQAIPQLPGLAVQHVVTAQQMFHAMATQQAGQDCVIMTAAVADFRPISAKTQKIKKAPGQKTYSLELETTDDILAALGGQKPKGQVLVGFALETNDEVANAQKKLMKKNLDCIVLNSLQDAGAGFGHDTNQIKILDAKGTITAFDLKSKAAVAQDILNYLQTNYALGK